MRSNVAPWLGAMALSISITGLSAAPIDLSLQPGTMQATGSVQPPMGLALNKKGLEALKPAGGQPRVSESLSKDMPSSIAKIGTDDMIRRPTPQKTSSKITCSLALTKRRPRIWSFLHRSSDRGGKAGWGPVRVVLELSGVSSLRGNTEVSCNPQQGS